jgi:hypothetical protein
MGFFYIAFQNGIHANMAAVHSALSSGLITSKFSLIPIVSSQFLNGIALGIG